jgi:hypothetical protein
MSLFYYSLLLLPHSPCISFSCSSFVYPSALTSFTPISVSRPSSMFLTLPSRHPLLTPHSHNLRCQGNGIQMRTLQQKYDHYFTGYRSRVSSDSIVSDYGLDDRAIGVRSPAGAKDFSSNLCVQTGSGAHPASYPMGTGGPFPGGKARPGRDADHSPPSSAEVVNE